ncbi:hypothetical protein DFR86_03385 [Acidianus sulfidivorans JP7]|uniref:hypothetical protein n=1 Tax=Acidianus sulfidivorans TaxID=312539 RepID=UPI0013A5B877|nr:hypothetical protein [Acidianus sulfidivorans]AWR96692.2 hypothetical protein DFR86_03385 [Acidianus sulfidivorans JP7]
MQFSKNSINIEEIRLPNFNLIAYGKGMELPAYTLERSIINLKGNFVKTVSLHELIFLEEAYSSDIDNVLIFLNDVNEAREFLDTSWALNVKGEIITCSDIKPKGNISVFKFSSEMCEVNLALSLLNSIAKSSNSPRGRRIINEMDFSDLDSFLDEKSKEIDLSFNSFVLSPILSPAKYSLEKNLGKDIKEYNDINFYDSIIMYTGVDSMIMRRIYFELKKEGKKVKEFILDVEPLFAPIYLSLISYYIKEG